MNTSAFASYALVLHAACCIRVCVRACVCVCVFVCVYVCLMHIYVCVYVCMYTHTINSAQMYVPIRLLGQQDELLRTRAAVFLVLHMLHTSNDVHLILHLANVVLCICERARTTARWLIVRQHVFDLHTLSCDGCIFDML